MEKHATQDLVDKVAHLLYNGGWLSVVVVALIFILVAVPVRLVREASRVPLIFWVLGYVFWRRTRR